MEILMEKENIFMKMEISTKAPFLVEKDRVKEYISLNYLNLTQPSQNKNLVDKLY